MRDRDSFQDDDEIDPTPASYVKTAGLMVKRLSLLLIFTLAWQAGSVNFTIAKVWNLKSSSFCNTNGEDGFSNAPTGAAQFVSLLRSYGTRPNWCVAGVDFAVGITPNATVNGNTITETGVVNAPSNGDQKSFYPQSGGSLPNGIAEAVPYYICNVSGRSGTYTFTLSTASSCSSTLALGTLATAFVVLKLPNATKSVPHGATGWNGMSNCGYSGHAVTVCINGNNVTLDHWDFSANGGWWILLGPVLNTVIANNYMLVGSNVWPIMQDLGNAPTNITFNNNRVDGNALAVYTTSSGVFEVGVNAITVSSTNGIAVNMTVGDLTTLRALQPGTLVASLVGATVNLSKPLAASVKNGDVIGFIRAPAPRTSLYGVPQISISDRGTTIVSYNWIRNTCSEHWQQSLAPLGGGNNSAISFKYNVFENTGWCAPINGAHGDVVQIYCGNPNNRPAADCNFQSINLSYNTVIQNNAKAQAGTSTFSLLYSGSYGASARSIDIDNNTAVYSVAGGVNTSTYGLAAINPSWVTHHINIRDNYIDPTSACAQFGKCGASYWSNIFKGNGGGKGPYAASCSASGNVNLVSGALLPKPMGKYC